MSSFKATWQFYQMVLPGDCTVHAGFQLCTWWRKALCNWYRVSPVWTSWGLEGLVVEYAHSKDSQGKFGGRAVGKIIGIADTKASDGWCGEIVEALGVTMVISTDWSIQTVPGNEWMMFRVSFRGRVSPQKVEKQVPSYDFPTTHLQAPW